MSEDQRIPELAPRRTASPHRRHGGVRGADVSHRSNQFEGRFGRMFRTLPAAHHSEDALVRLANVSHMTATLDDPPTPETDIDDEENTGTAQNPGISAGYTYFGQFIDHDLTFDPASSLQKTNDPEALTDYRTPRFDLDSIYGRGPDDQPYLYTDDGLHMLLGAPVTGSTLDPNTRDLPRNTPNGRDPARALIGDPRNDENSIVSQLQSTVLRFHNRVADFLTAQQGGTPPAFAAVQQEVRWHYQWAVLHDFLPKIIGAETVNAILPPSARGQHNLKPDLKYFKWKNEPYIPVEFSVAAYRFGHSMIRPIYRLNTTLTDRQVIFPSPSGGPATGLTGFQALQSDHAIDWSLFFNMLDNQAASGPNRLQFAYKIDTSLVNPLGFLPPSVARNPGSLAARNLLRGLRMGLPSGQAVANAMGLIPLSDDDLRVGKANEDGVGANVRLVDIDPQFTGNAPLWFYILAEAMQATQASKSNDTPTRLGPVGGRIVGEVFVGLLWGDSHSYLQQHPSWQPHAEFQRAGQFGIAEMILQAAKAA